MENTRGSILMALAMAAFAIEDMFIKSASQTLPVGQVLIVFGLGGMLIFIALTKKRKERVIHPAILQRPILLRALSEVIGRLSFTLAIAFTPLSSASAILQATPLVVVLGAIIFFKEKVGWRRWFAIFIGFVGVLIILRPGLEGFEPASIFAVIGTLGFAGRDLATRAAPPVLSNMQLGVYGFFMLIPSGVLALWFDNSVSWPSMIAWLYMLGAIVIGVLAYYALTAAMRTGDVSVVTPFRYTRLIFALILGIFIFGERPDFMTLLGSAVIVLSGLYSLSRGNSAK
ncbi:DMT family transporter [Cochlodiniinecator piscidefendens]|uniref:DMT family transporter n=1 Tax=Cochlodiniinecator piscidefendens TaxID=2715756 RepID=UPI00140D304E|nr:DMT family transporter [Cochlodiniinecator piscidefendens]